MRLMRDSNETLKQLSNLERAPTERRFSISFAWCSTLCVQGRVKHENAASVLLRPAVLKFNPVLERGWRCSLADDKKLSWTKSVGLLGRDRSGFRSKRRFQTPAVLWTDFDERLILQIISLPFCFPTSSPRVLFPKLLSFCSGRFRATFSFLFRLQHLPARQRWLLQRALNFKC